MRAKRRALIARFVVPARLLAELPEERPGLSVVLAGPDDAGLVDGADGVEAVELALESPRPRPADLIATWRALEPLGVEVYFELVLDDGWRDSVPAAIGQVAALGARVKLRCGGAVHTNRRAGGARDRRLPGRRRAVQVHGGPASRRAAR